MLFHAEKQANGRMERRRDSYDEAINLFLQRSGEND
jgi:hypothetical protein